MFGQPNSTLSSVGSKEKPAARSPSSPATQGKRQRGEQQGQVAERAHDRGAASLPSATPRGAHARSRPRRAGAAARRPGRWAALYVARTSFVQDGTRVFCLWDDAMISMTYARNLREGHGLVWNPGGERVQGYSNLGVTLVMAALHALPLPASAPRWPSSSSVSRCRPRRSRCWRGSPAASEPGSASAPRSSPLWRRLSRSGASRARTSRRWRCWLLACAAVLARARAAARRRRGAGSRRAAAPGRGALLRDGAGGARHLRAATARGAARRRAGARRQSPALAALRLALLRRSAAEHLVPEGDRHAATPDRSARRCAASRSGCPARCRRWRSRPSPCSPRRAIRCCASPPRSSASRQPTSSPSAATGSCSSAAASSRPLLPLARAAGKPRNRAPRRPHGQRAATRRALLERRRHARGLRRGGTRARPPAARREWLDPRAPTLLADYNRRTGRSAPSCATTRDPALRVAVHWAGVVPYVSRRFAIDVLGKSDRHIARLAVDSLRARPRQVGLGLRARDAAARRVRRAEPRPGERRALPARLRARARAGGRRLLPAPRRRAAAARPAGAGATTGNP